MIEPEELGCFVVAEARFRFRISVTLNSMQMSKQQPASSQRDFEMAKTSL